MLIIYAFQYPAREGEGSYPWEFDCEVSPMSKDFNYTWCPLGREFDTVAIFEDRESGDEPSASCK